MAVDSPLRSCFWESGSCDLLLNPGQAYAEAEALRAWLPGQEALSGHLVFRTSGTESAAKFVALSRAAFLASAKSVNEHLRVNGQDAWLLALPTFHVGGLAILARAHLAGVPVHAMDERWEPSAFLALCHASRATLASLVPTQLFDLVRTSQAAPPTLRAVLVGGGALETNLAVAARRLGWPILATYGMTETSSQVATQDLADNQEEPWLRILPPWSASTDAAGQLRLRGTPLFTGYVVQQDSAFCFLDSKIGGWFTTQDAVELDGTGQRLRVTGRASERLKIKGELVHLGQLRQRLAALANGFGTNPLAATLVAVAHERDGIALILAVEETLPAAQARRLAAAYNLASAGFERVSEIVTVAQFPRSPLGKLMETELAALVRPARL